MKSVDEGWQDYLNRVMPKDAGPIQVQECRRAFYAGGCIVMGLMKRMEGSDDEVVESLKKLDIELLNFTKEVLKGRA